MPCNNAKMLGKNNSSIKIKNLEQHRQVLAGMNNTKYLTPIMGQIALLLTSLLLSTVVYAHGVAATDASYIESLKGIAFIPYMYLGAKHMVTGYLVG